MATHRIALEPALESGAYAALDQFAASGSASQSLAGLAAFLAERFSVRLSLDPEVIAGFARDASNLPGRAEGLCRPGNERELAVAMRACFACGVPFTVSGGRSNLTGSATPEGGVVISTSALLAPGGRVDEAGRTVTAPSGVILEDLRQRVRRETCSRLMFPVDPTSRADASVGGALACNASGFTPGEAGTMRAWTEAVDFLLPNGLKVRARRGEFVSSDGAFLLAGPEDERRLPVPRYRRPAIKNAGGPYSSPDGRMDFVDLAVGSEGVFGVIAACTLRLQAAPSSCLDLFFSLAGEEEAVRFLEYMRVMLDGEMSRLSALEYFGVNCRRYMTHGDRLFHGADPVAIYVQAPLGDGAPEQAAEGWLDRIVASGCGIEPDGVKLLDTERDRALFMEARHSMPANSLEVVQRRGTYTLMTDTVVPPEHFREFLRRAHDLLAAQRLDYLSFGHLGDCHLHFMILPEQAQLDDAARAYDRIVAAAAELGGVYSGEHGTGKRKRGDFLRCYGEEAVGELRRCKAAVDPRFLLNRNNVICP
jgi:D-lactate dehydrogenase (cytochrome)